MFSSVRFSSSSRLTEVRGQYLFAKKVNSAEFASNRRVRSLKGLMFVELYGAYEHSIESCLTHLTSLINDSNTKLKQLCPCVMSVALDPECRSLVNSGVKKKWVSRKQLFERAHSPDIVNINGPIIPTDGANIKHNQLISIWQSFGITSDMYPNFTVRHRIEDMVEKRNAIAHGRMSASEVGALMDFPEMEKMVNDISEYCSYFIDCIEVYYQEKHYSTAV